jgi:hypothetical protein
VQGVQLPGGLLQRDAGQGGGGVSVGAGARVQAQAAEELLLAGIQVPVGQLERGGDAVALSCPAFSGQGICG